MKNRKGAGYVSPSDLDKLQVVFEAILAKHHIKRKSPQADHVASVILIGHGYGISDQSELTRYAVEAAGLGKSSE